MAVCSTRRGVFCLLRSDIPTLRCLRDRLQVAVAKIQQNIPELKRDGSNVLSSQCAQILYAENSTNRATTVFTLMDFIPQLQQQLQEKPNDVIKKFEELRGYRQSSSPVNRIVTERNILSSDRPVRYSHLCDR